MFKSSVQLWEYKMPGTIRSAAGAAAGAGLAPGHHISTVTSLFNDCSAGTPDPGGGEKGRALEKSFTSWLPCEEKEKVLEGVIKSWDVQKCQSEVLLPPQGWALLHPQWGWNVTAAMGSMETKPPEKPGNVFKSPVDRSTFSEVPTESCISCFFSLATRLIQSHLL